MKSKNSNIFDINFNKTENKMSVKRLKRRLFEIIQKYHSFKELQDKNSDYDIAFEFDRSETFKGLDDMITEINWSQNINERTLFSINRMLVEVINIYFITKTHDDRNDFQNFPKIVNLGNFRHFIKTIHSLELYNDVMKELHDINKDFDVHVFEDFIMKFTLLKFRLSSYWEDIKYSHDTNIKLFNELLEKYKDIKNDDSIVPMRYSYIIY